MRPDRRERLRKLLISYFDGIIVVDATDPEHTPRWSSPLALQPLHTHPLMRTIAVTALRAGAPASGLFSTYLASWIDHVCDLPEFGEAPSGPIPDSTLGEYTANTLRKKAAYRQILRTCMEGLSDDPEAVGTRWVQERTDIITVLRDLCKEHGDNNWPDDMHLGDVISKHLVPYLSESAVPDIQPHDPQPYDLDCEDTALVAAIISDERDRQMAEVDRQRASIAGLLDRLQEWWAGHETHTFDSTDAPWLKVVQALETWEKENYPRGTHENQD